MNKALSNQKLWKIIKQPDGYFYEIKIKGMVVDRIPLSEKVIKIFKDLKELK